jgi:hypothetical protein
MNVPDFSFMRGSNMDMRHLPCDKSPPKYNGVKLEPELPEKPNRSLNRLV